jgi:hypothetical protein
MVEPQNRNESEIETVSQQTIVDIVNKFIPRLNCDPVAPISDNLPAQRPSLLSEAERIVRCRQGNAASASPANQRPASRGLLGLKHLYLCHF